MAKHASCAYFLHKRTSRRLSILEKRLVCRPASLFAQFSKFKKYYRDLCENVFSLGAIDILSIVPWEKSQKSKC